MDYNLAALKLLSGQLKEAREISSQNAMTLGGILFQRAWLQGILVSNDDDDKLLLDDGTGIVELSLSADFRPRQWKTGTYVMVVGGYFVRSGDLPMIKVHKIVDLSPFPDREAMWYLEVLEAYKLFYKPLIEDFLFEKFLTQVDVERRLAVPSDTFRKHFELPRDRNYVDLLVKDSTEKIWTFRCSIRQTGNHPKPVFSAGWLEFVRIKGLQINDQVVFHKEMDCASEAGYRIEVRRRITSLMGRDIWAAVERVNYYRSGN